MWRRAAAAAMCTGALLIGGELPAQQSIPTKIATAPWGVVDAVGYGGLGFGIGLVIGATTTEGYEPTFTTIGIGSGLGLLAGWTIGHRAQRQLSAGRPISGTHRFGVSAGAVFAGATLGALAAVPMINGDGEGTPLGSDETALTVTTAAGTAVGFIYAGLHQRELTSHRVTLFPYRARRGGLGIGARTEF